MEGEFNYFDCIDEEESWLLPLTTSVPPQATQDLQSQLPSIANSQENLSRAPSPPMSYLSLREQSDVIPPTPGLNLEASEPTGSGVIQGKCLLLTWSQVHSGFSKDVIKSHLETLGDLDSLAVGQENHSDGGIHFHACAIYLQKIRRRPTAFAILGRTADVRVANAKRGPLQDCMRNYWMYAQKEDSDPLLIGKGPAPPKKSKTEIYREALALAMTTSLRAAMDHFATEAPVDYVQRGDTLERNLTAHRDKRLRMISQARKVTDFPNAPEIPDDWRCLYLWGTSGVGKTQFAKALLPEATVISHMDQLKDCDFSNGIIFDDVSVAHWPPTSVIHLLDWDEPRGIHCRYTHVVIPPHTRKIFTFNNYVRLWWPSTTSPEQEEAITRRIIQIEIKDKLF